MHRDEIRAAEVEAELVRRGAIQVVDPHSDAELEYWNACDLASAIEGAFHERIDPRALARAERESWLDRLGASYEPPALTSDLHLTRFLWLIDRGERAGTIALPASGLGREELPIWSLYVHPKHRSRGVATRVLELAYGAALRAGFEGIQLDTHWVWQHTLRFYLARRMWVVGWNDAIGLAWRRALPRYEIREHQGAIAIAIEGGPLLLSAKRYSDRVELTEHEASAAMYAHSTLAVELALRRWPLARSPEHLRRALTRADEPSIESLAHKIALFEERARHWGWIVRTA